MPLDASKALPGVKLLVRMKRSIGSRADGRRFPRGADDQVTVVAADLRGAFRPKGLDLCEPRKDLVAESTVQRVFAYAELFVQAPRTEEGNSSGLARDCPALPYQPEIKVQHARCVGQGRDDSALDRNAMPVNLGIENFA